MTKQFTALRTISTIFKISGIILFILAILSSIATCGIMTLVGLETYDGEPIVIIGMVSAFFGLIQGCITALFLYAIGEMVMVLLQIEENTRATSMYIQQRKANE